MKAFLVMGRTLKALYDELFLWVWLSVLWWVGTALIIPAAPVTLGLHQAANRVANYKRVDSGFFYESARQHIGKGWLLYAINILFAAMIAINIAFYFNSPAEWMRILGIVFLWVLVFYLIEPILLPAFLATGRAEPAPRFAQFLSAGDSPSPLFIFDGALSAFAFGDQRRHGLANFSADSGLDCSSCQLCAGGHAPGDGTGPPAA